ncbi:MAG: hypothetical protein QOF73_2499 [Thermomicrobiales bacterium]|jgi:hypothetical protein|nr:hypothetical protein [Thermomicrobiales bacterium]
MAQTLARDGERTERRRAYQQPPAGKASRPMRLVRWLLGSLAFIVGNRTWVRSQRFFLLVDR